MYAQLYKYSNNIIENNVPFQHHHELYVFNFVVK